MFDCGDLREKIMADASRKHAERVGGASNVKPSIHEMHSASGYMEDTLVVVENGNKKVEHSRRIHTNKDFNCIDKIYMVTAPIASKVPIYGAFLKDINPIINKDGVELYTFIYESKKCELEFNPVSGSGNVKIYRNPVKEVGIRTNLEKFLNTLVKNNFEGYQYKAIIKGIFGDNCNIELLSSELIKNNYYSLAQESKELNKKIIFLSKEDYNNELLFSKNYLKEKGYNIDEIKGDLNFSTSVTKKGSFNINVPAGVLPGDPRIEYKEDIEDYKQSNFYIESKHKNFLAIFENQLPERPKKEITFELFKKAVKLGDEEVVKKYLLQKNSTPEADDNYAICKASKKGNSKVVEALLKDGRADPGANINFAIKIASIKGRVQVVKLLLEDGRINLGEDKHNVIEMGLVDNLQVVKLLIKHYLLNGLENKIPDREVNGENIKTLIEEVKKENEVLQKLRI